MYNEIPALTITEQIFNTLLKVDENGNIIPELAESFEYVTPTELVIKIKQGVKFHNGDTLTSKDVAFSIKRMLDKPASRVMIDAITKVEIVDDYTIKLILSEPSSPLLFGLAHPLTAILNEKDTFNMDAIDSGMIEKNPELQLISKPTTSIEYITFNNTKAPFDNKNFRKAVNYALDKQSMSDSIFMGKAIPANSIVNPNVFGHSNDVEGYPYNKEKAIEYLNSKSIIYSSWHKLSKLT